MIQSNLYMYVTGYRPAWLFYGVTNSASGGSGPSPMTDGIDHGDVPDCLMTKQEFTKKASPR